jgi:hypothetical protein
LTPHHGGRTSGAKLANELRDREVSRAVDKPVGCPVRANTRALAAAEGVHPMTRQEAVAELSDEKRELLAVSELTWVWTHDAWGNKVRRKILSQEWVKARPLDEIKRALAEDTPADDWRHFFTKTPADAVLIRIIAELE